MKVRRLMCVLMACVLVLCSIIPPAGAMEAPSEIIWLEDLDWEWIDLSTVDCLQEDVAPQTTDSINSVLADKSVHTVTSFLSLQANHLVTFNCSYSPSSASVDFGVVTSGGKFYSINVKEGSIHQAVRINQAGNYAVAVRNNSSQTVCVVGFVNY